MRVVPAPKILTRIACTIAEARNMRQAPAVTLYVATAFRHVPKHSLGLAAEVSSGGVSEDIIQLMQRYSQLLRRTLYPIVSGCPDQP